MRIERSRYLQELMSKRDNRQVKVITGVRRYGKNASGMTIRTAREAGFVCSQGDSRYYVQSAYAILDKYKLDLEQASLLKVADSFRNITVVHDPIVPRYNEHDICMIGIRDFLLDPNSLGA